MRIRGGKPNIEAIMASLTPNYWESPDTPLGSEHAGHRGTESHMEARM